MLRRVFQMMTTALNLVIALVAVTWGGLALWLDGPASRPLAGALLLIFLFTSTALAAVVRPLRRGLLKALIPVAIVALWWSLLAPTNDRNWSPDVARLAHATFRGALVTIENLRNFRYRSENDFNPVWETRTYDLDKLRAFDIFLSFWGPTLIAHTIASWEFDNGQHLAISIETRKENGETYSAVRGFFRQYELYYVVADERDLVGLRVNYRRESVYLYRLRVPTAGAKALLLDYLREVNRLAYHPRWYNALTENCTTAIRYHAQNVGARNPFDWRILMNGRLDQLAYERGQIDTSLPFVELRKRSNITEKAKAADDASDFSFRIRKGLPGMN